MSPPDHLLRAVEKQLSSRELRRTGPLLDVTIQPECEPGKPCAPVTGKGMIDTGADRTAVDFLRLPEHARSTDIFYAQGVTSDVMPLPIYPLKMSFPGSNLEPMQIDKVAATPHLGKQGLLALIGRDVLSKAKLEYSGPQGAFRLTTAEGTNHVTAPTQGPLYLAGMALAVGAAVGAGTALLMAGVRDPSKTAGGPDAAPPSLADRAVLPVGAGVTAAVLAMMAWGAKHERLERPTVTPGEADAMRHEAQQVRLDAVMARTAPPSAVPSVAPPVSAVPSVAPSVAPPVSAVSSAVSSVAPPASAPPVPAPALNLLQDRVSSRHRPARTPAPPPPPARHGRPPIPLTPVMQYQVALGRLEQYCRLEGIEAPKGSQQVEAVAYDLGYQGRDLPPWIPLLGQHFRVDVQQPYLAGREARASTRMAVFSLAEAPVEPKPEEEDEYEAYEDEDDEDEAYEDEDDEDEEYEDEDDEDDEDEEYEDE